MNSLTIITLLSVVFVFMVAAKDDKKEEMVPLAVCKDWCQDHCKTECKKKGFEGEGSKHECKSDRICECTCPKSEQACTQEFCDKFCTKNLGGKKFEAHCKDNDTCQCKVHTSDGGETMSSNSKP